MATLIGLAAGTALLSAAPARGQTRDGLSVLTLQQAEALALREQPRLGAAELRAAAAGQLVNEARSAYLPTVTANMTGVVAANAGTAVSAGALTTSSLSDRFAVGGALTQLVTDFGRTPALVSSAHYHHVAQEDQATAIRAEVLLNVREAYYGVLSAEAVLRAAQEAQRNRQLTAHQVSELAQSQLKSTLDVNFAQVLESEAELAVVRAESTVRQARARLAAAIGSQRSVDQPLADTPLPDSLSADPEPLVSEALHDRPDVRALDAERQAAAAYASAEQRLRYPALNLLGAAGEAPEHDPSLHEGYAAAGFNLSLPLFHGGLFKARSANAALEAGARAKDFDALTLQVSEEVRDAWSQANDAFRSLDVAARLVQESDQALRLAQTRYDNGLGSIVELNEAQLNQTSAQITAADAKYTYLSRRANLDYTVGVSPQ
jgi:outer membrane protein